MSPSLIVCVCARARGCTRAVNISHVCAGVSAEEVGAGVWGENVRVRSLRIYFIFIVILNVST